MVTLVAAVVLLALHNVDEAFWHSEAGRKLNLAATLVIGGLLIGFFRRMRPGWRIAILALLGLNAVVQGMVGHVAPLLTGDGTALDRSGPVFFVGGVLLLIVAWSELRRRLDTRLPAGD
jgi:hypothetical protein